MSRSRELRESDLQGTAECVGHWYRVSTAIGEALAVDRTTWSLTC